MVVKNKIMSFMVILGQENNSDAEILNDMSVS